MAGMVRRLDQLLANLGYCSRRSARDFLKSHVVSEGPVRIADPSRKVHADVVRVNQEALDHPDGLLIMLHKPVGLVCSHDPAEGPSVYSLVPPQWLKRTPRITSVGRLDKDTSGLLLITDQGPLVHRLTSPRHHVTKRYRVRTDGGIPAALVALFASGRLMLDGERDPCAPAHLEIVDGNEAVLALTEGRYHQVRRMFASQGITVVALHRESFGDLRLEGLGLGEWRELPLDHFDRAAQSPTAP